MVMEGTLFICGPGLGPRRCKFCKRRARALCDWPVMKRVKVKAVKLRRGDVFITPQSNREVPVIDAYRNGEKWIITVELRDVVRRPPYPTFSYVRDLQEIVTTLRRRRCSAACCARHRRSVGPERDYCERHWNSWSEVAA